MSGELETRCFLRPHYMRAWAVFILALVFTCDMSRAQAQEKSTTRMKHLGFLFSGGIASYREDLLVPLSFDGAALVLGGMYTRQTEKNLLHIRLRFGTGFLQNRYSHQAYAAGLEIRATWLRKLGRHHRFGELYGGLCLPLQMNNLFFESWDDAHLYWLTAHGLGAALEWRKKISRKFNPVVRLEIPLLSFVSRPPSYRYRKQEALTHLTYHFSEPNRALHLETPDTYRALFMQMLFRREMRRALLNLGLEFQYNYCRRPQKAWGLNTAIFLSYQWRIGS